MYIKIIYLQNLTLTKIFKMSDVGYNHSARETTKKQDWLLFGLP